MVYNEKNIEIKGTVIDAVEGTPLQDSHIYIKGTHIGAVSDENGGFSLQLPLIYQNRALIVSYVGYESFEEKVSTIKQLDLQIAMKQAVIALDEIMVMPGKEILVDQAIEMVRSEYKDEEEMLTDFYVALFVRDNDRQILNKVINDYHIESN